MFSFVLIPKMVEYVSVSQPFGICDLHAPSCCSCTPGLDHYCHVVTSQEDKLTAKTDNFDSSR
jgi:hypothetical protein